MLQPIRSLATTLADQIREGLGLRAIAISVALLLEALLLLLLFTLGQSASRREEAGPVIVSLDARNIQQRAEDAENQDAEAVERPAPQPSSERSEPSPPQPAEPEPALRQTPEPAPAPPSPRFIPLTREDMASLDDATAAARPAAPSRGPMGPPDAGQPSDTPLVDGTGPNGEPLYAASWYREPRDDELRGYLSTARGPGWGLIACRTAPDYRVEDCVMVGEYPTGSNIARSVLAAAWQFRVRPPRIGGRPRIGEWVRIRIDYDLHRP